MNRIISKYIIFILIGIVLTAAAYKISEIVLMDSSRSLVLIGISLFSVTSYFSFTFRKLKIVRNLLLILSSILLTATFLESLLTQNENKTNYIHFVFDPKIQAHRKDKYLGAVPLENNQYTRAKYYKDNLIYDVKYTIDKHGLRVSPPINKRNIQGDLIFFGCSFTYGEGVQDFETMPYQVGMLSGGKYEIFNMGFSGYGPHQMLSALEHGRVEDIVGKNNLPKIFIYESIYDQIRRTFRPVLWGYYAPRYIIGKNGDVEFTGSFLDNSLLSFEALKTLRRSLIYRRIHDDNRNINKSNIDLFIKIISKSRDLTEKIFPGSEFMIIHWDNENINYEPAVLSGYKDQNLKIYLVSDIIKDYKYNNKEYHISQYDPHPNAIAHKLIAEFIVKLLK